jgi:hypothetical protein
MSQMTSFRRLADLPEHLTMEQFRRAYGGDGCIQPGVELRIGLLGRQPVCPENPNHLNFLTFTLAMITLERWGFPYLFTSCDKVCDHATRRLDPTHVHCNLVPLSSIDPDGTHRLAPSSRGL